MSTLTRRQILGGGAALAGAYGLGLAAAERSLASGAAPTPVEIEARTVTALLSGSRPTTGVMTYGSGDAGGSLMPPTLRMRRDAPFAARLLNHLDEPTTIHWHGLRIPNAMDGVPFLTQPYVYPGDSYDYAFTPPDAGTYWYHPHCNTLTQMGRGMTGLLIVEHPDDPEFDAEFASNLRDWRLGGDGQFIAQFKPRDAAKSGTIGTLRTANWQVEPRYEAPAGGLVRLRLAATDVTRIYNLKIEGAAALVVALDGQPLPRPEALDIVVVSPGERLDLVVLMPEVNGSLARLVDVRPSTPKTVVTLAAVGPSLKRALGDVTALAANPPFAFDRASATEIPLVLSATAENASVESICGTLGYSFWAINKTPWPGDTSDPTAPMAELKLGRSYVINLENLTPHAHPIHLHGMNFMPLSSSKGPVRALPSDTYLVLPDEKVQLALVADNPGDWVLHCHIIEHQKTGMTSYIRVV